MLKSAELEIQKMKHAAKKELEVEMNQLAVTLAEKIIKENLNSDLEAALADKFIDEVGSKMIGNQIGKRYAEAIYEVAVQK